MRYNSTDPCTSCQKGNAYETKTHPAPRPRQRCGGAGCRRSGCSAAGSAMICSCASAMSRSMKSQTMTIPRSSTYPRTGFGRPSRWRRGRRSTAAACGSAPTGSCTAPVWSWSICVMPTARSCARRRATTPTFLMTTLRALPSARPTRRHRRKHSTCTSITSSSGRGRSASGPAPARWGRCP